MFIKSKAKGAHGSLRNGVSLNTGLVADILFTRMDVKLILMVKGLILLEIIIRCG